MNALVLDPDDGRETGLRLSRHEPLRLPEPPPRPVDAALQTLGEMSMRLGDDLAGKAQALVDAGARLELLDMETGSRWVDGGERYLLEVSATFRIEYPRHA